MIDLITLTKSGLSEMEISEIVRVNALQTNSKDSVVFYDNQATKNLTQQQGVFIRVEANRKLKVECSLHKYNNEISGSDRNNYNMFYMSAAKKAINHLLQQKAMEIENMRVYNYEIGINLNISKDCRAFLDKMKSIGPAGDEKPLYVNARYKDERVKTTVFHKHTRKYFKVYDKVFESTDKKRRVIPQGNILRIETAFRRLDKCLVSEFFHPENLKKMIEAFFRDWRTVQFERDIITPKGTGRARQHLCIDVINNGKEAVLIQAKERYKHKALKEWEYRNIREFLGKEWDIIKKQITFIQSDEEKEFRNLINVNYNLFKNDDFIN